MKKKQYELYEEWFKSTIDNECHKETYCTNNKKIYEEKEKYEKSSFRLDAICYPGIVGFIMLFILFIGTGVYAIEANDIIPGWILISLGIVCIIGIIIFIILAKKNKKIFEQTRLWKTKFQNTKEFKKQNEEYAKIYKENLKNKLLKASAKLVDIYTALDGNHPCVNEYNRNSKIYLIADLLDIQDAEKILNINKK